MLYKEFIYKKDLYTIYKFVGNKNILLYQLKSISINKKIRNHGTFINPRCAINYAKALSNGDYTLCA